MPDNLAGVVVGSDRVEVVLLEQNGPTTFTVQDESAFSLQTGARPAAYFVLHRQLHDYLRQHQVTAACVPKSTVNRAGTQGVHLLAAELRGVVQCAAAASKVDVRLVNKGSISRNFGHQKFDEYLRDDGFWAGVGLPGLKKGKREAALLVVAEFSK
jgi:hypothetical protein